jgi:SPP1 family predicted phage head-tail adaptor
VRRRKNHRFQIQEQADDTFSPDDGAWSTLTQNGTIYAEFWTVSGKERVESQKTEVVYTHRLRIYKHDDMTTKNRLLYGSRVFDIIFIGSPKERTNEVIVDVKEYV